jgi:phage virion morphogenesis protein
MTGAAVKLEDKQVLDALGRLLAAAGNITPALKNIGEAETASTRQRFRDGRDPDGQAWAALNPLYAQTKKGPRILVGQTRSLSEIVWQLAGSTSVEIGSNVVYARIHNEGGKIVPKNAPALIFSMGGQTFKVKSVTIPKRQFLGFSERDIQAIHDIITDHLAMAIDEKQSPP